MLVGNDAGREAGETQMLKVTATHANGHVRCALCAGSMEEAQAKAETLQARGYWLNIEIVEFAPTARRAK
jgi:hypothetical protein